MNSQDLSPQLTYYNISARVRAFSTTRHGGYSTGNYAALNVNAYCGDSPETVERNRLLLCKELGLNDINRLIIPHQVHETGICRVDAAFLQLSADDRQQQLEGIDAVMTNERHVCIGVSTADCIPILIYDSQHHAAAVVHAGWRGTVKRIAALTVQAMMNAYNSDPAQLKAVIGPGISLKNFEVGREVYDQFAAAGFPMQLIAYDPVEQTDYQACPFKEDAKPHIDLPLCNRWQLEQAGLPRNQIEYCGICTYDQTDNYFSARRLGINSGRIYTAIILND